MQTKPKFYLEVETSPGKFESILMFGIQRIIAHNLEKQTPLPVIFIYYTNGKEVKIFFDSKVSKNADLIYNKIKKASNEAMRWAIINQKVDFNLQIDNEK